MAFCKVCACGEKIVFERRLGFPDNCPSCGRKLVDFITYNEDDPRVEEILHSCEKALGNGNTSNDVLDSETDSNKKYLLKMENGVEIIIPDEGCIVGRTEVGAEELACYPSVSRQHIRITPRRNIGVIIEDLSSFGTLVDGRRIIKNSPVRVESGAKITLCNVGMVLVRRESDEL